jgi:hypothetical protein
MELLDQSITFVRDRRRTAAAAWEGSAGQHPYIVASGPHASVPHDGGNKRAPERGSCPASAGGQAVRAVVVRFGSFTRRHAHGQVRCWGVCTTRRARQTSVNPFERVLAVLFVSICVFLLLLYLLLLGE